MTRPILSSWRQEPSHQDFVQQHESMAAKEEKQGHFSTRRPTWTQ